MIGCAVGAPNSDVVVGAQVKVRRTGQERQDIRLQVAVCLHPPGVSYRPIKMQAPIIPVRRDADLAPLAFRKEIASCVQVGTLHAYPYVPLPPRMVPFCRTPPPWGSSIRLEYTSAQMASIQNREG